jgi:hypothetical protein
MKCKHLSRHHIVTDFEILQSEHRALNKICQACVIPRWLNNRQWSVLLCSDSWCRLVDARLPRCKCVNIDHTSLCSQWFINKAVCFSFFTPYATAIAIYGTP